MSNYPTKKIGEVLEKIMGGGTPSKSNSAYWDGNIPWASVKDMKEDSETLEKTQDFITEAGLKNSAANLIPAGSIIISTRMGLGRVVRTKIDVAINQDLKALFPRKELDSDYLLLFLKSRAKELIDKGSGATVSGIRLDQLRDIQIPFPPIAEQKKIVARLEGLLGKIKEAKRLRAEAQEAAQNLLPAELHRIFSQQGSYSLIRANKRIVEKHASVKTSVDKWEEKELGEVLELCDSGIWGNESPSGVPLLRSTNMQNGELVLDDVKYIDVPKDKIDRYVLHEGDILITKSSGSVDHIGKSLFITKEMDGKYGFSNFTQRLRVDKNKVMAKWVHYIVSDPATRPFLLGASQTTTGLRNLKISVLKELKIPLPPVEEQKKIVARLDSLSEKIRRMQEYQKSTVSDFLALEQSILSISFQHS